MHATRALDRDQLADVLGADVPPGERRHLPDRLVLEQPDDRVDVLAPERVDVLVEQHLLRRRQVVVDGVGLRVLVGHHGVRALEGGVDGGSGGVERLGGLGGRPAQDVAQDQHGALARRQVLQRGDEREPDGVLLGDDHGGVRHRLQPRDLVVELERVTGHLVHGAEPGGQRAARPALEVGQADVGGDAVEPGTHRRTALEGVRRLPGPDQRLLDEVLGLVHGPAHPVAVRQQLALVALGESREVVELGGLDVGHAESSVVKSWSRSRAASSVCRPSTDPPTQSKLIAAGVLPCVWVVNRRSSTGRLHGTTPERRRRTTGRGGRGVRPGRGRRG